MNSPLRESVTGNARKIFLQSTKRRKLPPYAKSALVFLKANQGPRHAIDLRIFTGVEAWERAKYWHERKPSLVLPDTQAPEDYDWQLVAGCEPWVIETGDTPQPIIGRLILTLLEAGAIKVRLSYWDGTGRGMDAFGGQDHG